MADTLSLRKGTRGDLFFFVSNTRLLPFEPVHERVDGLGSVLAEDAAGGPPARKDEPPRSSVFKGMLPKSVSVHDVRRFLAAKVGQGLMASHDVVPRVSALGLSRGGGPMGARLR